MLFYTTGFLYRLKENNDVCNYSNHAFQRSSIHKTTRPPPPCCLLIQEFPLSFLRLIQIELEFGPMPNVMAALPNIGGALCSTLRSLADAHCYSAVQ